MVTKKAAPAKIVNKQKLSKQKTIARPDLSKAKTGTAATQKKTKLSKLSPKQISKTALKTTAIAAKPKGQAVQFYSKQEKILPKKVASGRTYKVVKGDTLQKISKKFYGTTKNWLMLYEVNSDTLKKPDAIFTGQVLKIPEIKTVSQD